jgi:hypothetical protein
LNQLRTDRPELYLHLLFVEEQLTGVAQQFEYQRIFAEYFRSRPEGLATLKRQLD